jgi:hypothetical protein
MKHAGITSDAQRGASARRARAHLVNGGAVALLHLVELIDAADAAVREHERAALKHKLARRGVALHRGGQADAG